MLDYVAQRDFNIQLGVQVQLVAPVAAGWLVESSAGTDVWPAVILASGRFCQPYSAYMPGIKRFGGQVLHSCAFRDEADFAGQRVMVVGNGPSGVDLVVALAHTAQAPVCMAQRTGIVLKPRYLWGLPKHAWMLLVEKFPGRLTRWLERHMLSLEYRNVAASGIKVPGPGEMSGAAGTRGPELLQAVRSGRAEAVDAPVDFTADAAILPDGRHITLDTLILATGFRPALASWISTSGWTNRDCPCAKRATSRCMKATCRTRATSCAVNLASTSPAFSTRGAAPFTTSSLRPASLRNRLKSSWRNGRRWLKCPTWRPSSSRSVPRLRFPSPA